MFRKSKAPRGFKNSGKVKEWKEDGVSATEVSFNRKPRLAFKRVGEIDDDEVDDRRHENEFEGLSDDEKLPAKATKLVTDGITTLGKGAGNVLYGMRNHRSGNFESDEEETIIKRNSKAKVNHKDDGGRGGRKSRRPSDDKSETPETNGSGLRAFVDTTTSYITSMRQPQADVVQKALKEGKRVDPDTGKVLGTDIVGKARKAAGVMETLQSYIAGKDTESSSDKSGKPGVLGSLVAMTGFAKTDANRSGSEGEGHDEFMEDTFIPKRPSEERKEKAEAQRKAKRKGERKGDEQTRSKRVTKPDEPDRPVTFVEGMTNVFNWALKRGAFDPNLQEELARRAKTQRLPADVDRAAAVMNKLSHNPSSKLVTSGGDPRRSVISRGDGDWDREEDSKGEWFFQRVFRSRSTPAESRKSGDTPRENGPKGGRRSSREKHDDSDDVPSERGSRSKRYKDVSDKGGNRKIRTRKEEADMSDNDDGLGHRRSKTSDRYDPNQDWDDYQDLENAWFFQRWAKNARDSSQKNKTRRKTTAMNSNLGTDTTIGAHAYKGRAREGEPDPGVFQSMINKVKDTAEQYAEEKISQVVDVVAKATDPKKSTKGARRVDPDLDSDWDSQSDDGGSNNKPSSLYNRFVEATGAAMGKIGTKKADADVHSDSDSNSDPDGKRNSKLKTSEKTWLGENYFSEYLNGAGASWLLEKVNPMNMWNGTPAMDAKGGSKGETERNPNPADAGSSGEESASERRTEESTKRGSLKSRLKTPKAISRLAEDIGISKVKSRMGDDSKAFDKVKMAGKTVGNAAAQNRIVRGVKQFKEKKTLFKAAALRMLDDLEMDAPKARTKGEAKEKMEAIAQRFKEDMMSEKLQMAKERLKLGKSRPKS